MNALCSLPLGHACIIACDKAFIDPRYDPHHPDFNEASKKKTATPEPSAAKTEPANKKSDATPVAASEPTPATPTPPPQYCVPCLR